jgi:sugar phosphate isomerase/epimerase
MAALSPLVGAALMAERLPAYRDWLIADQRDLEIQDPCLPSVLDGDWKPLARQIRELLDGYTGRLGIHGPFIGLTISAYDPKLRALVADRLRQGLEFAIAVGATHMVIHSPYEYFGSPLVAHTPAARQEPEIGLARATLEAVLPLAEQAGCTLVVENIYDSNPAPWLALVRAFESPFVRASIDTGHAMITQRAGGPPPDQWVREAGPLLAHMHLQDTDGHYDRHWAPGDGGINWYALFEALGELEAPPRMVLELRDHTNIPRGAGFLARSGLAR